MNPIVMKYLREYRPNVAAWYESSEYGKACEQFQSIGDRMADIAIQKYKLVEDGNIFQEAGSVRTEAATTGGLHRGYYCPSLVFDLVTGKVSRGKLLKRLTVRSKNYHLYGFNESGRLIWNKTFYGGNLAETEYLFYEESCIYGLSVGIDGYVNTITEEQYSDGKLVSYTNVQLMGKGGQSCCNFLNQEQYIYDHIGLHVCNRYDYLALQRHFMQKRILFEREEGLLVRYYCEDLIGYPQTNASRVSPVYETLQRRQA